ncbi:MAG: hypothetical protein LUD52_04805 [Opitutae bacterium]|nr:hypothetical protein [Opitutae bacterium]
MDKSTRKEKIKEILDNNKPEQTGTILIYKGERKTFDVYKIPLEFVAYNVDNGRISSLVKSYKVEHGKLDIDKEEDSRQIEDFLFNSSEERNNKTLKDLAENGQMEPGIITMDGVIVDGNRRVSLLRKIAESDKYPRMVKDRCSYFLTRVLPEDADEKEILRLETSYQMGTDTKVDYNPIEKYLHIKDMTEKGFSAKQIHEYMGLNSASEVATDLEIMDLIDKYLDTYEYKGIYTRLPRGCEDDFIKLNQSIKKIRAGKISWIQQNEIEEVVNDLQVICFDYIRLAEKGDFDYRAISYTSNNNFLSDSDIWKSFVERYYKISGVEEKHVEDILSETQNSEDTKRLLNERDNNWRKRMKEDLMDVFMDYKNKIDNKKEKNKPIALIRRALNALLEVDTRIIHTERNKNELIDKLDELINKSESIKRELS